MPQEESLAGALRQRTARQPVAHDLHGVNALLGRLRIEQERHRQNQVVRAARELGRDPRTRARYGYVSGNAGHATAAPPHGFSFHTDQVDPTVALETRDRQRSRRRTPGPSAPKSWMGVTSFASPLARGTVVTRQTTKAKQADRRWRVYEGWCEIVLREFIGEDQLPWEIRSRRARSTTEVNRWTGDQGASTRTMTPNGPRPLVDTTYDVLARYMDPIGDEPRWLADPEVKRYLGVRGRMTVISHGVWQGYATWRAVGECARGDTEDEERAAAGDEEWDAEERPLGTESSVEHLPILDFSFMRLNSSSSPSPSSTTTPNATSRALTRHLAAPAVRRAVRAISFAGTDIPLRHAIELLTAKTSPRGSSSSSIPWSRLQSVSLAGLALESVEDAGVALDKLARACPGLEFLDLSAIQLGSGQDIPWLTLLTTFLGPRPNGTWNCPQLRMLGMRDWRVADTGRHGWRGGPGATTADKVPAGGKEGEEDSGLEGYELEVKRLVRGFGRPRWVELVVR